MNVAYCFYSKIHVVFQNQKKIDFQMFVIHFNRQTLKTLFSPNSSNQNDFFNKVELYTFFLLYMWAKYEPIWKYFTAQTLTLGVNLLVKVQTIPQNAKCALFFLPKVAFTKIFKF